MTKLSKEEEQKFKEDYAKYSKATGMNPNPDDPRHHYDYRGLWKETGKLPDPKEHGDSRFKTEGHPRTYVDPKTDKGSATPKPGYEKTYSQGGRLMPSVSAKQHRLMAAVATNPAVAKKTKIPQSVGKEFMEADRGKKFKGGGEMKESKAMVKKEIGFMKKKGAPKSMIKHEMAEAGMKKGGMPMKKMASGGLAAGHKAADGVAVRGKTKAKQVTMKGGGKAGGKYC